MGRRDRTADPDPLARRRETGPFDVVGDVHGCRAELERLLAELGYRRRGGAHEHPDGRRAVFVGDIVDRGPDSPGALQVVLAMVEAGSALAVPGNHDDKLARRLKGSPVQVSHGLDRTLAQLDALPRPDRERLARRFLRWLDRAPWHLVLDEGRLVVAHAGLPERWHGETGGKARSLALFGDVVGTTQEGFPVRRDWGAEYAGRAFVAYGHTPTLPTRIASRTVNLDSGCAFGGYLTALRFPELELVRVTAEAEHAAPSIGFREMLEAERAREVA